MQMRRLILLGFAAFAVLALGATTAGAGATTCTNGSLTGTVNGNISAGPGCDLSNVTMVNGNVTVNPGGSLTVANGSTTAITGNVKSKGATSIDIEGGSIAGYVRIQGTTALTLVAFGTVGGDVEIQGGVANLETFYETIGGSLLVHDNSGAIQNGATGEFGLVGGTVKGNVDVYNNSGTGTLQNQIIVQSVSIAGNLKVRANQVTGGGASQNNEIDTQFNVVGGKLVVSKNTATGGGYTWVDVSANTVTNTLNCRNNTPAPTDEYGPNSAQQKIGQCA
jgi:hypothetical protein